MTQIDGALQQRLLDRDNHTGTQFAASISDLDATIRAVRLDEFAQPTGPLQGNNQQATNFANPTTSSALATKAYVDALASGFHPLDAVDLATTANITLSGSQTVDGVASGTKSILVKDQTSGAQDGIYTANTSGAWTRRADFDTSGEALAGSSVFVNSGTANGSSSWALQTGNVTLGTTPQVWVKISGAQQITDGDALLFTGNRLDVKADGTYVVITGDQVALSAAVLSILANAVLTSDSRLTDARTPTDASVTPAKLHASVKDPADNVAGARTLGLGAGQAAPGTALALLGAQPIVTATVTNGSGYVFNLNGYGEGEWNYTLGQATTAFSFPAIVAGQTWRILVNLYQDGTGGRFATYVGVKWGNTGSKPVLSTPAGAVDALSFRCNGLIIFADLINKRYV